MIHSIPFILNIIIILFSIIIPQITVIVACGHWDNHLHWHSSLYPDNSQLIYCVVGYCSFFQIGSKKFILHHLASCLLCFSSGPWPLFYFSSGGCILFCFSSAPCILYCFSSAPCILFCISPAACHTVLFQLCTMFTVLGMFPAASSLCILQGNWMSSSMIVTHLV